jgi:hypothetical protein
MCTANDRPHYLLYTRALLVSPNRPHLFVTLCKKGRKILELARQKILMDRIAQNVLVFTKNFYTGAETFVCCTKNTKVKEYNAGSMCLRWVGNQR